MVQYSDPKNWDQDELERARELAKVNVVSEGSSVPNAARLNKATVLGATKKPAKVLKGKRASTAEEKKEVQ